MKKICQKYLINDEFIFEKYNFKIIQRCIRTRDAHAERLQSLRETAFLLYNRVMESMKYGPERLKDIREKQAEEEAKE